MKKLFVIGCDRSGTTLLARALCELTGAPFIPEIQVLGALCKAVCGEPNLIGLRANQHLLRPLAPYGVTLDMLSVHFDGKRDMSLVEIIKEIYSLLGLGHTLTDVFVDHTPWADRSIPAHLFDDECYTICLLRNGLNVTNSLKSQSWGPASEWGSQRYWASRVIETEAFIYNNTRAALMKYEDFVSDPTGHAKALCHQFGIAISPSPDVAAHFKFAPQYKKQHARIFSPILPQHSASTPQHARCLDADFFYYMRRHYPQVSIDYVKPTKAELATALVQEAMARVWK